MSYRVLVFMWWSLYGAWFLGLRTRYWFIGVAGLTLWILSKGPRSSFVPPFPARARSISRFRIGIFAILAGLATFRVFTKWLRFEAGLTKYWDFGQYLQATYNQASLGSPLLTFEGFDRNYFTIHRSLSVYLLGWLYETFQSPWVLWIYQALGLIGFGAVVLAWMRVKLYDRPIWIKSWLLLLGPSVFCLSPVFSGQFHWAYNFHVLGLLTMGLAFLAESEKRWGLYVVCATLTVFESETYALILLPWSCVSYFLEEKTEKSSPWQSRLPHVVVAGISLYSLIDFLTDQASINQATHYFSYWGSSYGELLGTWLTSPLAALQHLLRWSFIKWILYFAVVSAVWTLHREVVARFLSLVPMMVLLGLGSDDWLINIRHHYSLQLFVAVLAILFLYALPKIQNDRRLLSGVALVLFASSVYIVPNPLKHTYEMVHEHRSTIGLDQVDLVQNHPEWIVCCASEACASFAARRYIFPVEHCKVEHPVFSSALQEGRKSVVVSYKIHDTGAREVVVEPWFEHQVLLR
jgi:hypothetical protein